MVADYPNAFSGHYNLGKIHLEAGRAREAVAAFSRAEALLPHLSSTASWLAAAHLAAKAPREALKVIEAAEARHGKGARLERLRARAEAALRGR